MSEHPDWSDAGFETRAIHAGYEPDPSTGAVIPPIYATSTYKQDGVGQASPWTLRYVPARAQWMVERVPKAHAREELLSRKTMSSRVDCMVFFSFMEGVFYQRNHIFTKRCSRVLLGIIDFKFEILDFY